MNSPIIRFFQEKAELLTPIINRKKKAISSRRKRKQIAGFSKRGRGLFFKGGDILRIVLEKGPLGYYFEGLCLSVRKKKLLNRQSNVLTRNIIQGVGLELIASYYLNRIYKLRFNDYKRKDFYYKKPRLFHLRIGVNQRTRVKY